MVPTTRWSEGAHEALPQIRAYLFEGDFERAHDLFGRTMMGVPYEMMKYQPFADLWLDFPGHEGATDYRRSLDLGEGVARVSYVVDGVTYLREVFSSAVDQVLVVRISADRPGAVTFSANLHGVRNPAHSNYGTDYFRMDGIPPADLRVTGKSSDYLGIEGRLRYEGRLRARVRGGTSEIDYRTLRVQDADEAVLVFAAATSFVDYRDVSADPAARVQVVLSDVEDRTWEAMRAAHEREHRSWFDRVDAEPGGRTRARSAHRRAHRALSPTARIPAWRRSTTSSAATCSSPAPVRARSPPTSRASGTTTRIRGGTASTPSTSTCR